MFYPWSTARVLFRLHAVALSCLLLAIPVGASAQLPNLEWETTRIARGLKWEQLRNDQLFGHPQRIQLLRVKTKKRPVEVVYASDTLLRTGDFGKKYEALAVVNGSFFDLLKEIPETYLKVEGEEVAANAKRLDDQDSELIAGAFVVTDRNRVLVEPARPETLYRLDEELEDVLVTGPLLIIDKNVRQLADNAFNNARQARTCACKTRKNELILLTADGAAGLTLPELIQLLLTLRCRQAVNLDGGGSTTLWIDGQGANGVVNQPADGAQRPVVNAIIIK